MNAPNDGLCQRLFNAQPLAGQLSLKACQLAIVQAEEVLERGLIADDFEEMGSKILVPLLLLASTQMERSFKWRSGYRQMVAKELLERLKEESGEIGHD